MIRRFILLLSVSIIMCFSNCRRHVTKTETFTDSSEVVIPRDTVFIVKGATIDAQINIDSILTIQEGQMFKRFDSLNRSYLSIVRNGRNLEVECNCLDTTINARLNDKIKTVNRKETKTITLLQKYIPQWVWVVFGVLAGAVIVLFYIKRN